MIKLLDEVRDSITGYQGIAMGRAEYAYGCVKVLVVPTKVPSDGNLPQGEWIDEQRLTTEGMAKTGGPQSLPPRS